MSREDWVLGVARSHPLASRDVVSVEELADQAIFGVPDSLTGELFNPLYPTHTPKGRAIPRRGMARTFAEVLALVAQRENVFPAGASFPAHYGHPEVVFVPLHGWPPGDPHAHLARARQHRAGNRLHRHRDSPSRHRTCPGSAIPATETGPAPGCSTLALSRRQGASGLARPISARTGRSGNVSSFVPVPAR